MQIADIENVSIEVYATSFLEDQFFTSIYQRYSQIDKEVRLHDSPVYISRFHKKS